MTAGSLSTLFAWAALICTLAGAVSTGVSLHYRSISSKEKELEIASIGLEAANSNAEAAKAHERIAVLSTQAEQLRKASAEAQADIAKARANIASAAARNKEAELKLEQLRKAVGPRSLSAKFNEDLKDKPGCNVLISYVADAGDTWALATMIYYMLPRGNGWSVEHARAITEQDRTAALARLRLPEGAPIPRGMDIHFSATGAVRGLPTGVTIVIGPGFDEIAGSDRTKSMAPIGDLMRALEEQLGGISYAGDPELPEKTVRIVVAPKP